MNRAIFIDEYRWEYHRGVYKESKLVLCKQPKSTFLAKPMWLPVSTEDIMNRETSNVIGTIRQEIANNSTHPYNRLDLGVEGGKDVLKYMSGIGRRNIKDVDFTKVYLVNFFSRFSDTWKPVIEDVESPVTQ